MTDQNDQLVKEVRDMRRKTSCCFWAIVIPFLLFVCSFIGFWVNQMIYRGE